MRRPQPNILDEFSTYLDSSSLQPSTKATYWGDLSVVVRALLQHLTDEQIQAMVEAEGYSGDYKTALRHLRKVALETQVEA